METPIILENVTITLPPSYKADLEAALKDLKERFPKHTQDQLLSWAVRFYLDRFTKMQEGLVETWFHQEKSDRIIELEDNGEFDPYWGDEEENDEKY